MNLFTRASISAAMALAVAASASPALGADYTLNLSGPTTGVVGQPMVFQVSGNNYFNPDYGASFWYSVGVIPTGVVPACPSDRSDAIQVATSAGEVPVFTQQETLDWDGNFSQTFVYRPSQPGTRMVCAYTVDLTGYTLAKADVTVELKDASAGPAPAGPAPTPAPGAGPPAAAAAKPANTTAPRVTRSGGKLVCTPGRWSNATGRYAYGWSVNGKRKKGAGGRTLRISRALRGRKIACSVTASNAAGSATVVSRPVRVR